MSLARVAAAAGRSAALPLVLSVSAIDLDATHATDCTDGIDSTDGTDSAGTDRIGFHDEVVLPVASTAKLLLLAEIARRLDTGELHGDKTVDVLPEDRAGGTGLLGRLGRTGWTVEDLCWLTASVSDNTATNALLRLVGRDATARLAERLALRDLTLHDSVRDVRGPGLPPVFATGTARDLARLVAHAARGTMVSAGASARLLQWMRANTDHGLVPALVAHDPYAPGFPAPAPGALLIANKTGTDTGVRADVGLLIGTRRLAYAVVAHWDTALGASTERAAVHALRDVGRTLADCAMPPDHV
ncbi:serine hydrolase [Streptomyces sp. NPDC005955]|uniref:serine hydrolase n=1 Tax=Streptomyces sp. NPDC005955 TaxID=3364738 RepID=UPI0036B0B9FF